MRAILCCLLIVKLVSRIEAASPYVCYASDQDPYLQFGSKTAYEFSAGRTVNGRVDERGIPGCRPLQVWMVARHGAGNPSAADITKFDQVTKIRDGIVRNYQDTKSSKLCTTDLQNLQNWNMNFNPQEQDRLTNQGREDTLLLARRIKSRFPDIFNQQYNDQKYTFRHTNTERTMKTAEAFFEGVFPGQAPQFVPPQENDTLLRSYKGCAAWQERVDDNPETLKQMELFLSSPLMKSLTTNVSQRLGFSYDLPIDGLLYAYDICRYEKASNIKVLSPWCAIFTADEMKLIEYAEDLKYYFNAGYGNSLNLRVGCPLLKDFMYRFRRIAAGTPEPAGVFYFTHQTTILTLLARMGVGNDPNTPTHTNYLTQTKRQWRTSSLSPYGANLMAVFLNCTIPSGGSEYKVAFYLQETILPLKDCNVGLCSWNMLRDRFSDIAENCNLNRTCSGGDNGVTQNQLSISLLLILLLALFLQQI